MPAQNLPVQISIDLLDCMGVGLLVGLVRILFSYRNKVAAATADFICTGFCFVLLQSYAVGYSQAGVLRWYMLLSAAAGAWSVESLLAGTRNKISNTLRKTFQVRHKKIARTPKKPKSNEKRNKKQLQKNSALLYNSNV